MEIDIKDLLNYLAENIEDFKERCEVAISRGYRGHIMPSQTDKNLTDEIFDKAREYADDNEIDEETMDEYLTDEIDNIFFES